MSATTNSSGPLKVFLSYSHKDEDLWNELDAHLAMLKRSKAIEVWNDRKIPPGTDWDPQIAEELETADLVLLLISSDFLNSEFCFGKEMKRAMERHDVGAAHVIPIALRPCDWTDTPFSKVQGLPKDLRPVISPSWPNRDEAFTDIAKGIRWRAELLAGQRRPAEFVGTTEPVLDVNQPTVSMSLRLQGILLGMPVSYGSSATALDECAIDSGTSVTLTISLDSLPANGYAGWDTHVYCESMLYEQAEIAQEVIWPDSAFPARAFNPPGSINYGAAAGIGANASYYVGPLLKLSLRCLFTDPNHAHGHAIYLIAHGERGGGGSDVVDEVANTIPATSIGRAIVAGLGSQNVAAILRVACRPIDGVASA